MFITKNNKEYIVKERENFWLVSHTASSLSVEYKIYKDLCPDAEALRAYLAAEKLF